MSQYSGKTSFCTKITSIHIDKSVIFVALCNNSVNAGITINACIDWLVSTSIDVYYNFSCKQTLSINSWCNNSRKMKVKQYEWKYCWPLTYFKEPCCNQVNHIRTFYWCFYLCTIDYCFSKFKINSNSLSNENLQLNFPCFWSNHIMCSL